MQEEIKIRLKSVNAGCHMVQNLLSSSFLYILNYNFSYYFVWV